jgi:hypothetical protein
MLLAGDEESALGTETREGCIHGCGPVWKDTEHSVLVLQKHRVQGLYGASGLDPSASKSKKH